MNPLEFDGADFGMHDSAQDPGDAKLYVVFHRGTKLNEAKSLEAGRRVHDDVNLVTIRVPGQRDSFVTEVEPHHKARFPRQWAAFQQNAEQLGSGTQLTEVPWLTPAQLADLRAVNVHTVEQLVAMSDANAHVFMGFQGLKQRAQAFLDAAAGAAPALKLQAELEKRDSEIAELRAIVERLASEKKADAKKSHHKQASDSLV